MRLSDGVTIQFLVIAGGFLTLILGSVGWAIRHIVQVRGEAREREHRAVVALRGRAAVILQGELTGTLADTLEGWVMDVRKRHRPLAADLRDAILRAQRHALQETRSGDGTRAEALSHLEATLTAFRAATD